MSAIDADLLDLVEGIVAMTPERLRCPNHKLPAGIVQVALMQRAAQTSRGALLLGRNGFGEQALMLSRTVFEDMIDVHWIAQNSEVAVERFNDASVAQKQIYADRATEYRHLVPEPVETEDDPAITDEEQARVRKLVKDYRYGSWTRMSLAKRIEAVQDAFGTDLDRSMLTLFSEVGEGTASDFVHASPYAIYSQLDVKRLKAGDGINFFVQATGRYVDQAALMIGWSFAHLLLEVQQRLEVDGVAELTDRYFEMLAHTAR